MISEICTVCKKKIEIAIFKGTDFCSDICKKTVVDVSSVGTFMFLTSDEAKTIRLSREPGRMLRVLRTRTPEENHV